MSNPAGAEKKDSRGQFFAVDSRVWPLACDLGLAEAVCYLVIACGTAHDNRTSSWSAKAISAYSGLTHLRAQKAIAALEARGLLSHHPSSSPPLPPAPPLPAQGQ